MIPRERAPYSDASASAQTLRRNPASRGFARLRQQSSCRPDWHDTREAERVGRVSDVIS